MYIFGPTLDPRCIAPPIPSRRLHSTYSPPPCFQRQPTKTNPSRSNHSTNQKIPCSIPMGSRAAHPRRRPTAAKLRLLPCPPISSPSPSVSLTRSQILSLSRQVQEQQEVAHAAMTTVPCRRASPSPPLRPDPRPSIPCAAKSLAGALVPMFRASASPASPPVFCLVLVRAKHERTLSPRVDPRLGRVQHTKAQRLFHRLGRAHG